MSGFPMGLSGYFVRNLDHPTRGAPIVSMVWSPFVGNVGFPRREESAKLQAFRKNDRTLCQTLILRNLE
jgi:hypothetical protein